jgi:hypothetical protein
MSEDKPSGMWGAAVAVGDRLLTALPAQFLILVLLNTIFIIGLLVFLAREDAARVQLETRQSEARERVIVPLLTACVERVKP